MQTPLALFLGLLAATAFIAHWSDNLGKKLGKKRVSVFGLRPRTSATLLTVVSSWGIMIFTLVALLLAVRPLHTALFSYDKKTAEFLQKQADFIEAQKASQERLQLVEAQRKTAQSQAETAGRQTRTFENQATTYRGEANKALRDSQVANHALDAARVAERAAKSGESSARSATDAAQKQERQARTALVSAKSELVGTQTNLRQTRNTLGQIQGELAQKKSEVSEVQSRLTDSQQRLLVSKQKLVASKQKLVASKQKLFTSQKQLFVLGKKLFGVGRKLLASERQVLQAQKDVEEAQKRVTELKSTLTTLQNNVDNLQARYFDKVELATGLAFSDIRLRFDQTLAERRVDANNSPEQIKSELHVLVASSQDATQQLVPDVKVAIEPLYTLDAKTGERVALGEEQTLDYYASLLAASNQGVSARLVSASNYPEGQKRILARFVFVPVRTIYTAQQTIGESTIDATKSEAAIFGQLQDLVETARLNAVKSGSNPPLSPEDRNFFDGDTGQKMFDTLRQLQRLGHLVPVRVVAARDLDATEPLQIRFQIGQPKSGAAGGVSNTT